MTDLKNIRRIVGLTQSDLARQMGVTQSMVAKWETGDSYPRGELLTKLADTLGCTIDELFGRNTGQVGA